MVGDFVISGGRGLDGGSGAEYTGFTETGGGSTNGLTICGYIDVCDSFLGGSGAALVGLKVVVVAREEAKDCGLEIWLDEDSTKVGGLMNDPRRVLFFTLPD